MNKIQNLLCSGANVQLVVSLADLKEFALSVANDVATAINESRAVEDEFLTAKQVTEQVGCDRSTLWRWEKAQYLVPVRRGCKVCYRKSDVQQIMEGTR